MAQPKFLITDYINSYPELDELRKQLYNKNILSKDYVDDGLFLIYHKYDQPITSDLDRECRSMIIDRKEKKVVSYSCDTPLTNSEVMDYLLLNQSVDKKIFKCYEGSLLSIFSHNNKWYVSTRRCLDSNDSVWGTDEKSHRAMFLEVLNDSGYKTFEDFTSKLDKELCYYFVLIHHNNKHIVDYQNEFGENYKKLCLVIVREKNTQKEVDIYTNNHIKTLLDKNIFLSETLESLEEFDNMNKKDPYTLPPKTEGVIIKVFDNQMNKYKLLKLQTMNYQFAKSTGNEKNIFKGLIHLYQNNKLVDFFNENALSVNYKKIINPLNTNESYDTLGHVDAIFKICTSELFELFKTLYDIKTGKPKPDNDTLYKLLPKEYKDVLYGVRGLYYKKKAEFIKNQTVNHLQIDDIYKMLKSLPTDQFCALLKMRKLMFNWSKVNNDLQLFTKISSKCDKVQYKLAAIYTNKLFPHIMPDEYPVITSTVSNS